MVFKKRPIAILIIISALICPSLLYAFEGKVVSVSDGDTIKVLKDGKQVKIRLAAIDCPEKGQPYGQKEKQLTARIVDGKVVKVWQTEIDVRYTLSSPYTLRKILSNILEGRSAFKGIDAFSSVFPTR